jgi:F5/8 type C domain
MWLLSLGPAPTMMGETLMYRGPYALLMNVPGFSALRVPARFWMMSVLCLSVVGAIVFSRLASRLTAGRRLLSALVILGVLADGWIWNFPIASVPESWIAQKCAPPSGSTGAVMELPLGDIVDDVGAMYRSISHTRPTVNGYSGYFPPHYSMLRYALNLRDEDVLTQLAAHGVEFVLIERGRPSARALRRYVAEYDNAELVCADDVLVLYRLRGSKTAIDDRKTMLPISGLYANVNGNVVRSATDGDLNTRWETGPQESGMMLEIDLGSPRSVSAVELSLGPFNMDFPRGLRIEASDDRVAWREVWRGSSAGRAVIGALRDRAANPLVYDLGSTRARYLRLWLTKKDTVFYWSVAELKVFGS